MGVRDLLSYAREKFPRAFRPLDWSLFEGCVLFFDAAAGVYNCIASRQPGDDVDFLRVLINQAKSLKARYNITVVYVVDGERNQAKRAEEEWRAETKATRRRVVDTKAAALKANIDELKEFLEKSVEADDPERATYASSIANLEREYEKMVDAPTLKVNKVHYENLTKLLVEEGLLYVVGKTEAEKCCAWAAKNGFAHAVASDDSDCLAYGSPVTLFNTWCSDRNASRPKYFVVFEELLREMNLDRDQFVQMCSLCHNDYNRGRALRGVGPATAYEAIKKHKTIEAWRLSPDFGLFRIRKKLTQEEIDAWDPSVALAEFGETDVQAVGLCETRTSEDLALEAACRLFEDEKEQDQDEFRQDDLSTKLKKIVEECSTRKATSIELGRQLSSVENKGLGPKRTVKRTIRGDKTDLQLFEEREDEERKEQVAKRTRMLTIEDD